jgi:hypothetical protein
VGVAFTRFQTRFFQGRCVLSTQCSTLSGCVVMLHSLVQLQTVRLVHVAVFELKVGVAFTRFQTRFFQGRCVSGQVHIHMSLYVCYCVTSDLKVGVAFTRFQTRFFQGRCASGQVHIHMSLYVCYCVTSDFKVGVAFTRFQTRFFQGRCVLFITQLVCV